MTKRNNKKGFTLMEMLIVVAIIAILIAIAIPAMSTSLNKARRAADLANIRSAYAEAMIEALDSDDDEITDSDAVAITSDGAFADNWPSYLGTMPDVEKGDDVYVHVDNTGAALVSTNATETSITGD